MDEFLDFRAGEAMDGVGRATQDAKAEMRIKIGCVKTVLRIKISNLITGRLSLATQRK